MKKLIEELIQCADQLVELCELGRYDHIHDIQELESLTYQIEALTKRYKLINKEESDGISNV